MASDRIIIIGAGGHSKVVIATARACGLEPIAAFDDDPARVGGSILGVPVTGPLAQCPRDVPGVIAIHDNRARGRVAEQLGLEWRTLVHPGAIVHSTATLGPGCVVFAGAVVQPDAKLGAHVIVNTAATIDYDCKVERLVHLAPGVHLGGSVTVEEGVLLGIGAVVTPSRRIGAWAVVSAGAVVIHDVRAGAVVRGVPAR